jgi:hypothetical protein
VADRQFIARGTHASGAADGFERAERDKGRQAQSRHC